MGRLLGIRALKKFYGNLFNVESAEPEDLQKDILNCIEKIEDQNKTLEKLERVIARNLVAWDNSKDKTDGLLPEVYLTNQLWYENLTGETYREHKAVKKYDL